MPRKAIDYSKSCIYQFEYKGVVYYVGSTTNFTNRKSSHKRACNNPNNIGYSNPIYKFIRDNEGWDAWKMVLIEYYQCKDGNELTAREQYWFNTHKPNLLNTNYPSRDKAQYYIDNKVKLTLKDKKYRHDNKVDIAIKSAIYRENNKIKIAKYKQEKLKDVDYQVKVKDYNAKYYKECKARKSLNPPLN